MVRCAQPRQGRQGGGKGLFRETAARAIGPFASSIPIAPDGAYRRLALANLGLAPQATTYRT